MCRCIDVESVRGMCMFEKCRWLPPRGGEGACVCVVVENDHLQTPRVGERTHVCVCDCEKAFVAPPAGAGKDACICVDGCRKRSRLPPRDGEGTHKCGCMDVEKRGEERT